MAGQGWVSKTVLRTCMDKWCLSCGGKTVYQRGFNAGGVTEYLCRESKCYEKVDVGEDEWVDSGVGGMVDGECMQYPHASFKLRRQIVAQTLGAEWDVNSFIEKEKHHYKPSR